MDSLIVSFRLYDSFCSHTLANIDWAGVRPRATVAYQYSTSDAERSI